MKNRKILLTFLSIAVILVALLGFSSCSEEHTHSFSNWESFVEPTCTAVGVEKRTCACEHTEYKTTAALQHTPVTDAAIDATCTSAGKTEGSHCGTCKTVLVAQTDIAPAPHSFTNWESVVEPSCSSLGVQKRTCKCGYTEYNTTESLQHTPVVDAAIDATCTSAGKTEGSHCGTCGAILTVQNTVNALGHRCDNVTVLEKATCNAEGCKRFSCSNDGCSYYYDESYSKKELSAPEITESAMEYVGCLQTFDSGNVNVKYSTAIVISADGKILTSYAALNDAYYATFTLGEKTYDVTKVLAYDASINLAVLKIDATDLTCATICDSAPVTGETVYSIGNALGVSLAINGGIVSNTSMTDGDKSFIQHDAILMSGYGGGPLLNRFGEVIGVNFGTYEDTHFRLAIPITQLSSLNYDNPISMEENFNITYTIKDYIVNQIKAYATENNSGSYYFEHATSKFAFALGYNEFNNSIFAVSEINLEDGYQLRIILPLEMVKDESYQYQITYTDGKYSSDITGIIDPATYGDPNVEGSSMLTYDTFLGRYWDEKSVMDACSYGIYETLRWLSYCFDTYFFNISLKDTFGFTALSYEYDDTALEKLNRFVESNGTFNSETGEYLYSTSQDLTGVTIMYGIHYRPAKDETESETIVSIYCATDAGEVCSVSITLNSKETGNLIELFSGLWNDADQLEALNNAWGYIDVNSFTDMSEIECYAFEGSEEYEDKLLASYSALIPYLLEWVDSVMPDVEAGLSIRDLGFLFYFLP